MSYKVIEMESITIKVEDGLAREINHAMRPYYSTKTEFIREAIRDKLMSLEKEKALQELKDRLGSMKAKTTAKEDRQIREAVGDRLARKLGIKL
jgi:metal-responsive CopG/Arc/MetJ family transcriptional regulator